MGKATVRAKQKDYNNSIGDRLCRRIAEMGYTQEQFRELSGVPKSTLTKHMNNTIPYRIDTLMKYAEILECSYDYLLGYSDTPRREFHEVKKVTRLSDRAIEILSLVAQHYDSNLMCRYEIETLDTVICNKDFIYNLMMYCGANKRVNQLVSKLIKATTNQENISANLKDVYMANLLISIHNINTELSPSLLEYMRDYINREEDYLNKNYFSKFNNTP